MTIRKDKKQRKDKVDTQKGKSNPTTLMVLFKSHKKRIKYEEKKNNLQKQIEDN